MNLTPPIRMQMRTVPKGYVAESAELGVRAECWCLDYLAEKAAEAINIKYKGKYHRLLTEDDIAFSFTLGGSSGNG